MYEQEEYQRCIVCTCRHYYDKFTKHGCFLDGVRYTGEENANLTVVLRAKRFTRYMQVCCNLHRGRDYAYIQKIFFPLYSPRKRRMRTPSITPKTPSNKKAKTFDTPDSTTDDTDKDMWLKAIESARLSIESTTIKDNDLPPKTSSTPGGTTINTTSDQTNRTSSEEECVLEDVAKKISKLSGPGREAALMKLAKRIKVTIVGEQYSLHRLIRGAIAVKAAPAIHAVIADEVIRLGVGRNEYRKVVKPLYNRIRDAIGWVDTPGALFCPKWGVMKDTVTKELSKGPNKAVHKTKSNWKSGGTGCVWTEVDVYLAERLVAYRSELPSTYRMHLKTIATRVSMVDKLLPGMKPAIRVPIDLQDDTKLVLALMADGALLYRRAKIKVAMSQTEVVASVLNEGVQSAHLQIPFFLWANGDSLKSHLENAGYELLQRYTTNEFVVRMPAEYGGAQERIAKVAALVGDSKWIWSMFGVVQNWTRPLASGPFTNDQVSSSNSLTTCPLSPHLTHGTHFRSTNQGCMSRSYTTDIFIGTSSSSMRS